MRTGKSQYVSARRSCKWLTAVVVLITAAEPAPGQAFLRGGVEFNVMRPIGFSADQSFAVVVTQFFHHGEISSDGRNVGVFTKDRQAVPCRILQLGPGDFCRLAFQTTGQHRSYDLFYGGGPLPGTEARVWNDKVGLFLETRQYVQCNLNSFASVRKAFESSTRIGSDYVDNIRHAFNPFSLNNEPFLSRYSGYLRISSAGTYGFYLSSQDCSFLVIDDKLAAEAPGRHPPLRRADPKARKDVKLSAGAHRIEFYHAANGPTAMMSLAWNPDPGGAKSRPEAIPTAAFGTAAIGHVQAGPPTAREGGGMPDFAVNIVGEVPLPDNPVPLIGVRFLDTSSKSLSGQARFRWDFGDGQTSEEPSPNHVYLTPGLYNVKFMVTRGGRDHVITNRVPIDQPRVGPTETPHQLDQYLPVLLQYNPQALGAAALRQFVLAFHWKADQLLAAEPDEAQTSPPPPKPPAKGPSLNLPPAPRLGLREKTEADRKARAAEFMALAVQAGAAAFVEPSAAAEESELVQLARLIGPMARNQQGDSLLAGRIWHGASQKVTTAQWVAECAIEAADIALNDLGNLTAAKGFLDAATAKLRNPQPGPVPSRLQRVWGDYYAASGDGKAARAAYEEAENTVGSARTQIERIAWQGAHSRSAEQFLKSGEFDRMAEELRAWQDEFPGEKIGGYLQLMFARYWAGRKLYAQAVAQADQLLAVSPDSPYIDQLLMVAAECEVNRERTDRALATLHSLVQDYPGSPLVPQAKEAIAKLEAGKK